ncbi:MAG: DUF6531 domain-containing protein, partial [Bacteroidota bacterium]
MIPAVKMLDPVMGIDIHIIMIPTPGGPVPTPIPHPFTGMVFDPCDLLPIIGATVMVNGMPRAQAGTAAMAVPPHIPIGGPFMKPPANEGEMFMGSSTVLVEGEPFTYMGLPVLSCNDIGVPPPPRPKKKGGTKSMVLPTSIVMSIPAGLPVLVGGPPTVSLTALGMRAGMAALGKAAKKLRKLQKSSKRMKNLSKKIHKAANKAMKKLGVPPSIQNKVHKGICSVTGHPVDIASGKVYTDVVDFEFPGPIPIVWERTWFSTSVYEGPLGHGWHHPYDLALEEDIAEGAVAVRMADGRPVAFPILEAGEEVFSRAEKLSLSRDEAGYALRDKQGLTYRFGPARQSFQALQQIRNDAGQALDFAYDSAGKLASITDHADRELSFTHDRFGRIIGIHAPNPDQAGGKVRLMKYDYDAAGNMIQSADALNQEMHYVYRGHLLVKETNRNGLSFHFEYDGYDHEARCLRTWGDKGIYDHKLTYAGGLTIVENSLGHQASYYHNGSIVHQKIDNREQVSFVQYNEFNEVILETDELGRQTGYEYDQRGNRIATYFPDGTVSEMTFDGDRLVSGQNQIGGTWAWVYNELGQLTARQDPMGRGTAYRYEGALLTEIIDAAGEISELAYDDQQNLVAFQGPDELPYRWQYDGWGRVVASIDPNQNEERRTFDLLGRVVKIETPDGNQRELTYDPEGNIVHAKDQQREIRFEYTGMNKLAARIEHGTRIAFGYDTEEQLTDITNEHGSVYQFYLDPNGQVEVEAGFDQIKRHYRRDAAGQVISVGRASGIETFYEYDLVGRIVGVEHRRGTNLLESESFAYRPDGELMSALNSATQISFERNLMGQITREQQGAHWVAYEYDKRGLQAQLKSSLGVDLAYARNAMGDVEEVAVLEAEEVAWTTRFKHDIFGLETERRFQGGLQSRWERDKLGRAVKQEIVAGGQVQRQRTYTWEANDRLKQIVESAQGPTEFGHDAFGNLAWAQYADGTREYRMPDEVGNLFRTEDRKDRTYGPAGQLLEAAGTRYSYDEEGNLIRKQEANGAVWRYVWHPAGWLDSVTRPDGKEVSFTYDPLGRRISKSYEGRTTRWIWAGNVPLHEWSEATRVLPKSQSRIKVKSRSTTGIIIRRKGEQKATPTHGPPADQPVAAPVQTEGAEPPQAEVITWLFQPDTFTPLAKIQGGQYFGIVTDHLGTPIGMYDVAGQAVFSAEMSVYGQLRNLEGDRNACPFRFPGQYEDEETGLYYNRFRYYDPSSGGYSSPDPVRHWGGLNFYSYVSEPNLYVDPFGWEDLWYRALSQSDMDSLNSGGNIVPKDPSATNSAMDHVLNGSTDGYGDQYISLTKDEGLAKNWAS